MIEAVFKSGHPDPSQRRCYDCKFCQASVSWWCVNQEAIESRGTSIPGIRNCPYWEAMRPAPAFSWKEFLFGNDVLPIDLTS